MGTITSIYVAVVRSVLLFLLMAVMLLLLGHFPQEIIDGYIEGYRRLEHWSEIG